MRRGRDAVQRDAQAHEVVARGRGLREETGRIRGVHDGRTQPSFGELGEDRVEARELLAGVRVVGLVGHRQMGEDALEFVNSLEFPLSRPLEARLGELQRFTPTIEALSVPDIDLSLDEQAAKTKYWNAFKPIGDWWAAQPPY